MLFHESKVVGIGTTRSAGPIDPAICRTAFSMLELERAFSGKVDIPCVEQAGIYETIQGFFAERQLIFEVDVDIVHGLSLKNQRRNEAVGKINLFPSQIKALAHFCQSGSIVLLCTSRRIDEPVERTGREIRAGVANVGRL